MTFVPRPQEIYRHFKGNLYQITAIAQHTETGELLVVYQALYGDFKTYARPLSMFTSYVDREKYPDCTQEFRFELQGPEADRQRREMQAESRTVKQMEDQARAQEMDRAKEQMEVQAGEQEADMQQEPAIDPMVLAFLDADSYEDRLNILTGLHHRITNEMMNTMAVVCDIELPEGEVEERYENLKGCLLTLEKYECNRLR